MTDVGVNQTIAQRNCRHNLLHMSNEEKGNWKLYNYFSSAFNSCNECLSCGGGGVGSDCYSSLVTCLFLFTPSVLLFKHNFISQPHMLPRWLEPVCLYINDHHLTSWFCTFLHMAMDAEWNHQRKFQCRYLPWIGKEMSYYVSHGATLIINSGISGKRIWRNMQEEFHSAAESCCEALEIITAFLFSCR